MANEITPIRPQPPANAQGQQVDDALRVLEAETRLLDVERACREAMRLGLEVRRETSNMTPTQTVAHHASRLPSAEHLETLAEQLERAISAPPDRRQTLALLALAEDSYGRGDRPAGVKLAVAAHDLVTLGFSPFIVARALRDHRRTSRFPPTVSEVVEACELALSGRYSEDYTKRIYPTIAAAENLRELAATKRRAVAQVAELAQVEA